MPKTEAKLMFEIVNRAAKIAQNCNVDFDHMTMFMDLSFAHAQMPLELEKLLQADDGDFIHDVFGIRRHMDRDTKKLTDCFVPRFTA